MNRFTHKVSLNMPTPVYEFTLPHGYHDQQGRVHRSGLMRLATARDEIEPLADPRVRENEAFLGLLLLSRVVTRLGEYSPVPAELVADLYAADFAYLQELYFELNGSVASPRVASFPTQPVAAPALPSVIQTVCPNCQAELTLDLLES